MNKEQASPDLLPPSEAKKKIEAILFATGRFCELEELLKHVQVKDRRELRSLLRELQKEYDERDSAIRIIEQDTEFKMVVRDSFLEDIRTVLSNMDISRAVLETLAIIAWKKSIIQSDLVKIRGNSTYEHVKELEDLGFIVTAKEGVSKKLTLTEKFYDYFNLGGEELTNKMRRDQQERLRVLEEAMRKKEAEERRIFEEEQRLRYEERKEQLDEKKKAFGIGDEGVPEQEAKSEEAAAAQEDDAAGPVQDRPAARPADDHSPPAQAEIISSESEDIKETEDHLDSARSKEEDNTTQFPPRRNPAEDASVQDQEDDDFDEQKREEE